LDPKAFPSDRTGRVTKTPAGYSAFVPNPLPPQLTFSQQLIDALSTADRAIGRLDGLSSLLPNPYLLIWPFLAREAVLSSRIEGTQASLSDLFLFEAAPPPRRTTPIGKPSLC
jgi:Fic family protein